MSWRGTGGSKPWPWPNSIQLGDEEILNGRPNGKYEQIDGQILGGSLYNRNAFTMPNQHYVYKGKKITKDRYAKNKAKFERRPKLPPITETHSEISSRGSTRSRLSAIMPRYNPNILSDVFSSDEEDDSVDYFTPPVGTHTYPPKHGQLRPTDRYPEPVPLYAVVNKPKKTDKKKLPKETHPIMNGNGSLHRKTPNGKAFPPLEPNGVISNGSVPNKSQTASESGRVPNGDVHKTDMNDNVLSNLPNGGVIGSNTPTEQLAHAQPKRPSSLRNCYVTLLVVVVVFALVGAGVAAYVLSNKASDGNSGKNVTTVSYDIVLKLNSRTYTPVLASPSDSLFRNLQTEVCQFVKDVSMQTYLLVHECSVKKFESGSIIASLELGMVADKIRDYKTNNPSVKDSDITERIKQHMREEILNPSVKTKDFVQNSLPEVTNPSPQPPPVTTTAPIIAQTSERLQPSESNTPLPTTVHTEPQSSADTAASSPSVAMLNSMIRASSSQLKDSYSMMTSQGNSTLA